MERNTHLDRRQIRRKGEKASREKSREPTSGVARALLELQRSAGNAAVTEMISVQRDGGHTLATPVSTTDLDDRARAIITAAQATTPAINERAVNAVWAIINTYYSDKKGTVSGVTYSASEPGLLTTSHGRGDKSTGSIAVGHYFITNTTDAYFARRVAQVGHELEHIQQYREGKGGEGHRHEREFLAFYHEGLNAALAHTGRISHATRVDLMDQAIRNYNAMTDERNGSMPTNIVSCSSAGRRSNGKAGTRPPTRPPSWHRSGKLAGARRERSVRRHRHGGWAAV